MLSRIGMAFIAYWIFMRAFPPGEISLYYGYRSKAARKSEQSWEYANKRFSGLCLAYGAVYIFVGAVFDVGFDGAVSNAILAAVLILLPIVQVEASIRRRGPGR